MPNAATNTRFAFGENWQRFANTLTRVQIDEAAAPLRDWFGPLDGKSFLDIGSGSGIVAVAARQLGATVHAFDYDPESVACGINLRAKWNSADDGLTIERGDILNTDYIARLGSFDIVYSWGVLHHTGEMWRAIENAASLVAPGGRLLIALYNEQGRKSRYWQRVKRLYNSSGIARLLVTAAHLPYFLYAIFRAAKAGQLDPERGMSRWHDYIDWIGGYPFETADRGAVVAFLESRGFHVLNLKSVGDGSGCNEFLFERGQQ